MAGQYHTLRETLSQQKFRIWCNASTTLGNTRNPDWPDISQTNGVFLWTAFNAANLNDGYGQFLDQANGETEQQIPRFANRIPPNFVVRKTNDVKHLISWNADLMEATLQHTESQLNIHPGIVLLNDHSTADGSRVASLPNVSRNHGAGHVIKLHTFAASTLVVGFGRPSSLWSGTRVADQLGHVSIENMWPLRQLANICKITKTRYGYIQTDEELVVCCFSRDGAAWKVAIMPIPWTLHGTNELTTDLALWWLCLLAMSARDNGELAAPKEMFPIHDWKLVFLDEQQFWAHNHRYLTQSRRSSDGQDANTGNAVALSAPASEGPASVAPSDCNGVTAVDTNGSLIGSGSFVFKFN